MSDPALHLQVMGSLQQMEVCVSVWIWLWAVIGRVHNDVPIGLR